jgi:gluconolactonase
VIARNDAYPFAHEAGICIPSTGEGFITSNHVREKGVKKIQISKVKRDHNNKYVVEEIDPGIVLANGAVKYREGVLFCEQGSVTNPGGLVVMQTYAPYTTTPPLTNYHGRWFNSVNDVMIHSDGSIWFTDLAYGFEQDIRPRPQLPNQR